VTKGIDKRGGGGEERSGWWGGGTVRGGAVEKEGMGTGEELRLVQKKRGRFGAK